MSSETNTTPEKNKRQPNYRLRRTVAAVALTGAGAASLFGGGKLVNAIQNRQTPPNQEKIAKKWDKATEKKVAKKWDGSVDSKADLITIYPDAHLRTDPVDTDDDAGTTNLEATTNEKIEVPVNGVVISHDINGDWVTLAAQAVRDADPDLHIKGDEVSIITQKASVHDEGSTDVSNQ
jgi:peptidyl-tRNA hydrolase